MRHDNPETVLFVCNDESITARLLCSFFDAGIAVIGPTPRAATALALTAQTAPTVAVVAGTPTGRRTAEELAGDLMSNWGVRSWIWDAPHDPEAEWALEGERLERLRIACGVA